MSLLHCEKHGHSHYAVACPKCLRGDEMSASEMERLGTELEKVLAREAEGVALFDKLLAGANASGRVVREEADYFKAAYARKLEDEKRALEAASAAEQLLEGREELRLQAEAAKSQALEALRSLLNWIERGLPAEPDHSCGPESGRCDGTCVDWAYFCDDTIAAGRLLRESAVTGTASAALSGSSAPQAPSASREKELEGALRAADMVLMVLELGDQSRPVVMVSGLIANARAIVRAALSMKSRLPEEAEGGSQKGSGR